MNDLLSEIGERLERFEAVVMAQELISSYCLALDNSDVDAIKTILSSDIRMTGEVMNGLIGVESVVQFLTSVLIESTGQRRHFVTNFCTDNFNKGGISARCYFFSYTQTNDALTVGSGRFCYKVGVTNGTWKIIELSIFLDNSKEISRGSAITAR